MFFNLLEGKKRARPIPRFAVIWKKSVIFAVQSKKNHTTKKP